MSASVRDLLGMMRAAQKRRRRAFRDWGGADTPEADMVIEGACRVASLAVNDYFNARAMAEYRRGLERTKRKERP